MKTRTPVSSVILYIFGIIFLIVAGFMLMTAISYTKMYLASLESTFEEMWSNSVQYVIGKFLPYFGMGVVCIGVGKAISVFKKGQAVVQTVNNEPRGTAATYASNAKSKGKGADEETVEELSIRLKELREIGSIKLEEMEKREKIRLEDLRENVVRDMAIHRLQREAKEEEIISKLNALGEKMGLDMMDLYAKADIPVVPETEPEGGISEQEPEDKLKDDPTLTQLEEGYEVPEEPDVVDEVAEEPETEEAPEQVEAPEEPETEELPEEPEVVDEVAEEPETEEEPEVEEEPEIEDVPEVEEVTEEPEVIDEVAEEPETEEEPEVEEVTETEEAPEEPETEEDPDSAAEADDSKTGFGSKKKQKKRKKNKKNKKNKK